MPSRRISKPRFPCPNCGEQRESNSASCTNCRYPNHNRRETALSDRKPPPGPLQFHLRSLFLATAIAAIFFAIYSRLGSARFIDGLRFAGQLAVVLYPVIWFFYHSISNIMLDDWMWTKETERQHPFDEERAPKQD